VVAFANEGIKSILEFIHNNPGKRVSQISELTNIPAKTIERWIKQLKEQGHIEFRGSKKTGGYYAKTKQNTINGKCCE